MKIDAKTGRKNLEKMLEELDNFFSAQDRLSVRARLAQRRPKVYCGTVTAHLMEAITTEIGQLLEYFRMDFFGPPSSRMHMTMYFTMTNARE